LHHQFYLLRIEYTTLTKYPLKAIGVVRFYKSNQAKMALLVIIR